VEKYEKNARTAHAIDTSARACCQTYHLRHGVGRFSRAIVAVSLARDNDDRVRLERFFLCWKVKIYHS
jgi:hypothetical protein